MSKSSSTRFPALLAGALCLGLAVTAAAGELRQATFHQQSYAGSRDRQYQVYVPDGLRADRPVPMVMVLHGCRQTERNMINETRFRELADRNGFVVVFPFITSWEQSEQRNTNCWGFWFDQHIHEGVGEVEDLYQIAREVEARFPIDPERRYVTGLSSGAAMAIVLAVARSEYFAAVGAAAGLPYSETDRSVGFFCANPGSFKPISAIVAAMRAEQRRPEEQRAVPLMLVHSINDCTVNRQASENSRDAWLERYGVATRTPSATSDCTTEGVACAHNRYGAADRSLVETVFYTGERGSVLGTGSHYWVGDNSGEFANARGPSASELFWAFFEQHPFSENRPPALAIASATADGTAITVQGTASDPENQLAQVRVGLEGRHPVPPRTATGTTDWTVRFEGLSDNARYTPVATATDAGGAVATVRGAPVVVGTPPEPQPPVVTIGAVVAEGSCVSVSGTATAATEGASLVGVDVQLGTRDFAPAALADGGFTFHACDLVPGTYATRARATDSDGASATVAGAEAVVRGFPRVVADWQGHMAAQRLRVYRAPCPSVGFGACDVGFSTIFLTHGFDPFPLHQSPSSGAWYLDPARITATQ
jgi:poly(hydroxyalkanoate) depolymerase family esterase